MGAVIVLDVRIVASLTSPSAPSSPARRSHTPVRAVTLQGAHVCALRSAPPLMPAYYIPIAVFETLIAVLAVARWIHECRDAYAQMGFLQALVYDSVLYFSVMTLAFITNVVMWIVIPRTPELPVGLVMALSCVMASRLLLNIRARQRDRAGHHTRLFGLRGVDDGLFGLTVCVSEAGRQAAAGLRVT